ncbi:MAG: DUF4345 domain-containing protein [Alphaproteobacteria bacterium]
MYKTYQMFLSLFGVTVIFISLMHILYGPSFIPGSIPVNATMDSEDRFYATIFLGYGLTLLWCVHDIERKSRVVYLLAGIFFAGGLSRLVSMADVGMPIGFFIIMTILELIIPFFMVLMQWRIAKQWG